jgi:hypothetical protein
VYKLQNGTAQRLDNIVIVGTLMVPSSSIVASRGAWTAKLINPRTGVRVVTWTNFSLAPGEEATLTVTLPSARPKTVLASSWTAVWKPGKPIGITAVGALVSPNKY